MTRLSSQAVRCATLILWLGLILAPATGWGQSLLSIAPEGWGPPEGGEYEPKLLPAPEEPARVDDGAAGSASAAAGEATADNAGDAAAQTAQGPRGEPAASAPDGDPGNEADSDALPPEMELEELLEMVEEGRGQEAYPQLQARVPVELERARLRGEDTADLERALLVPLLRAGEGIATPESQERIARRFSEKYPDADEFPLAFFYLTRARFAQGKPLEESFFFDDDALRTLPAWMQSSYLTMRARAAADEGKILQAAGFLLTELSQSSTLRATRPDEVEALLQQVADVERLEAFLDRHPGVDWLVEKRPFLRARALVNQGEFGTALLEISRISREGLATSPEQIKAIHAVRAEIETQLLIVPRRIGVLLPLSSSSSALRALARETLDGLRLAVRYAEKEPPPARNGGSPTAIWNAMAGAEWAKRPRPPEDGRVELVIRDTGNDPERAAGLVEKLALDEHVMAIVGPIARSESAAAADAAENFDVPLVSLSLTMELPADSHFVFRHSKSQEEEVRDVVRFAMDYAGARRFVMLYPETGYGRRITELFWAAVEEKGGRVVGAESYRNLQRSPFFRTGKVGLKEIFERFTGLDRPQEQVDLALQEAVGDSSAEPIVDFDAIFIPIGPTGSQDLRLIAPYPVTVDAEKVLVLGNRFWNSDEVIVASDGKLNGAVFVDTFDRMSLEPRLRTFRRRHRIMFGHRSDFRAASYYTAFAYDTVNLLLKGVAAQAHPTRAGLARWLVTMEPYSGVTGLTTFLETGEAVKESMFFRLEGDRIRRILP